MKDGKVEAQNCFTIELLVTTQWRENHDCRTQLHNYTTRALRNEYSRTKLEHLQL